MESDFKCEFSCGYTIVKDAVIVASVDGIKVRLYEAEAKELIVALDKAVDFMATERELAARAPKTTNVSGVEVGVGVTEFGCSIKLGDSRHAVFGSAEEFRQLAELLWGAAEKFDATQE